MRVGILGAGKLGSPVALAFESKGHDVLVTDKAEWVQDAFANKKWPHRERGVPELMEKTKIRCVPLSELVKHSEIIFVAVQTPHEPQYGGAVPLPADRKDFDYTHLKEAVNQISVEIHLLHKATPPTSPVIAVISTVLPGTMRREILPLLPAGSLFVYCPFFAAMGTVVEDVLDPEFVLMGTDANCVEDCPEWEAFRFLASLSDHKKPGAVLSIESAELAKVAYNTFIEMKVTWANTVMEIAHKVPGCDCDDVTSILKHATDRLVSPRYMDGGSVGGGNCHPRDNIAMSWLAEKLDVRSNFFEDVMQCRESQAKWLVELFLKEAGDLPKLLLGKAYKSDSELIDGSAGLLMAEMLKAKGVEFQHLDPYVDGLHPTLYYLRKVGHEAKAFLICTKHKCFKDYKFPPGSVVVDVFRFIPPQDGVKIISVGRGQ